MQRPPLACFQSPVFQRVSSWKWRRLAAGAVEMSRGGRESAVRRGQRVPRDVLLRGQQDHAHLGELQLRFRVDLEDSLDGVGEEPRNLRISR